MSAANSVCTGPTVTFDAAREWAAYEKLPQRIRAALQEAPYNFSAPACSRMLDELRQITPSRAKAEIDLLLRIDRSAHIETTDFAADYEAQHGTPYPHVAAGASIQRYHGDGQRRRAA